MWKKIDRASMNEVLNIGSIITNDPDDPNERYVIDAIQDGYVRAVHANGKVSIKGLPAKVLVSGNWWVKE